LGTDRWIAAGTASVVGRRSGSSRSMCAVAALFTLCGTAIAGRSALNKVLNHPKSFYALPDLYTLKSAFLRILKPASSTSASPVCTCHVRNAKCELSWSHYNLVSYLGWKALLGAHYEAVRWFSLAMGVCVCYDFINIRRALTALFLCRVCGVFLKAARWILCKRHLSFYSYAWTEQYPLSCVKPTPLVIGMLCLPKACSVSATAFA